jgi:hypothetical protein
MASLLQKDSRCIDVCKKCLQLQKQLYEMKMKKEQQESFNAQIVLDLSDERKNHETTANKLKHAEMHISELQLQINLLKENSRVKHLTASSSERRKIEELCERYIRTRNLDERQLSTEKHLIEQQIIALTAVQRDRLFDDR